MHDMHCHLDFMKNASEVAQQAESEGSLLFANCVTPDGWLAATRQLSAFENVRVGFGSHPWWAESCIPESIETHLEQRKPLFLGEIGLDFGKRHIGSRPDQEAAFKVIARWAGHIGGRTLSIHSVSAAREALDILQEHGVLHTCTCIFHWYSGPSDQLKRAIDAGCFFSVNGRMLKTKKGREYVKAIPLDRLAIETDAPANPGALYSYDKLNSELQETARQIEAIKGAGAVEAIERTSTMLLSL